MITAVIPTEFEVFVANEVALGNYRTTDEVILEGLRLLRERKLDVLRVQIQVGIDELDRGEGIVIEDEAGLQAFFDDVEVEVYKLCG